MESISQTIICVLSAVLLSNVQAWGDVGHRVVATLAERNVSTTVLDRFHHLLPYGESLAEIANFADRVKYTHEWHWTERLHYADTPDWQCSYNTTLDCPDGCNCVVGAIANYTQRLQMPESPSNNRTVALMLLVHFVGDLAQPLHVGFASNRGGNEDHGEFCGEHTNLHKIWDEDMIERRLRRDFDDSENDYIDYLWQRTTDDVELCTKDDQLGACIERWASDSASLACEYAYVDENGQALHSPLHICEPYYNHVINVVERQLIVGGARLAYLLHRTFHSDNVISIDVM